MVTLKTTLHCCALLCCALLCAALQHLFGKWLLRLYQRLHLRRRRQHNGAWQRLLLTWWLKSLSLQERSLCSTHARCVYILSRCLVSSHEPHFPYVFICLGNSVRARAIYHACMSHPLMLPVATQEDSLLVAHTEHTALHQSSLAHSTVLPFVST
jgi:hypothetical protein